MDAKQTVKNALEDANNSPIIRLLSCGKQPFDYVVFVLDCDKRLKSRGYLAVLPELLVKCGRDVSLLGTIKDTSSVIHGDALEGFSQKGTRGVVFRAQRAEDVLWLGWVLMDIDFCRWMYWKNMKRCEVENRVLYLTFPFQSREDNPELYSYWEYSGPIEYDSADDEEEETDPANGGLS